MRVRGKTGSHASAAVEMQPSVLAGARPRGRYRLECFDRFGRRKWADDIMNLVVNAGLNHLLDVTLKAGAQIATWYVGLTAASPSPAAGDTMSSHAGWTEFTTYSEAVRQTWQGGTVSGQSVDNSANKAAFSINGGGGTVGGAFLVSNSTKGGTTGTLYSCGALTGGNRAVVSGDTVRVTYTATMADDGV